MPMLRPDGKGAPPDWRWAQTAFDELLKWGKAAGEPTLRWYLTFPSRMEKFKGQQWRLNYTEKGRTFNIYVGWDGRSVAETLQFIIKTMRKHAQLRSANLASEMVIHDELVEKGEIRDPIFDSRFAAKVFDTWQRGTRNIRTRDELEGFKRSHRRLMEILGRRAGILDMSLLQYLTRHPDAKRWPNPPETDEEWFRRHPELRRRNPRKDSNA